MRNLSVLLSIAGLALAGAPAALASTPASGEVSSSHLSQSWSGTATSQPMNNDETTMTHQLCIAPFCDTFSLNVKDAGNLKLHWDAPGSAGFVDVLVTKPDGSTERLAGNDTDTFQEIVYEQAATGTYTLDIWTNEIVGVFDGNYTGTAELCTDTIDKCFLPPPDDEGDGE